MPKFCEKSCLELLILLFLQKLCLQVHTKFKLLKSMFSTGKVSLNTFCLIYYSESGGWCYRIAAALQSRHSILTDFPTG